MSVFDHFVGLALKGLSFSGIIEGRDQDFQEATKKINKTLRWRYFRFRDNSHVHENSLNKSSLYLTKYGSVLFSGNLIIVLKGLLRLTDRYTCNTGKHQYTSRQEYTLTMNRNDQKVIHIIQNQ